MPSCFDFPQQKAARYGIGLSLPLLAGEILHFLKTAKVRGTHPLTRYQVIAIRECLIWSEDRESYAVHDEICGACMSVSPMNNDAIVRKY
jgi:hypothetical protein